MENATDLSLSPNSFVDTVCEAHVSWIVKHNYYCPDIQKRGLEYCEIMKDIYQTIKKISVRLISQYGLNVFRFNTTDYFRTDMRRYKGLTISSKITNELECEVYNKVDNLKRFITVGFNHQEWTITQCVYVIKNILQNKIFKSGTARFELFRENGEHPHCHFLVTLVDKLPNSKIVEKIYATKGIKKVVLKKSFIDVKECNSSHENYIQGNKCPAKMPYVERDKLWRLQNQIPEFFER